MSPARTARASRRGFLAAAAATAALAALPAAAQALVEGQNFLRLKNPQPVDSGKKIEVLEFFSYGCPHCRDLDPELVAWAKRMPADVEFRRVPVDYGREQWAVLARAYYTLEALGVEEKLTPEVFSALHDKRMPLFQDKAFFDWAASKGLDRKKVEDTYNSFGVASKFNRSRAIAKNYNVQSVPLVIVDGKFQVSSDKVGSHAAMPAAIDQLIAKARAERPKS
jgi:thiol:disulfide interchange protein DsbA